MDATQEVDRLLREHGAVLVRNKKHCVYQLPNGAMFTRSKTSSDQRAPLNDLTTLRHALGIAREKSQGEPTMEHQCATPPPVTAAPPPPAPAPEIKEGLKQRIEAAISSEEAVQEKLLAEAQAHERRVHMLRALLPFAEDPATEEALRGVLPVVEPQALLTPAPPEPPQVITERVQVTRQLVLAATQTFDRTFTVNDVMALMTGGREINGQERQRVRSSIAQAVVTLFERGELVREAQGFGKRQAVWRKAVLNNNGRGSGVGTRA